MNNISNKIYKYFLQHFDELPLDKQFHLASRLYTWSNDKNCEDLLRTIEPRLLPTGDIRSNLAAIHEGRTVPLLPGNRNVLHLRRPFNDRYPQLRSTARLLYWAAMLEQAYGVTARPAVSDIMPDSEMQRLYDALMKDDAAVAMLSTHAVNFLFLYRRYHLGQTGPDPQHFGRIAENTELYDFSDPLHTQLRIYLLTHTIIADSLFYAQPLPVSHKDAHLRLTVQLESILAPQLGKTSLDVKLEFLVCCRLTGHASSLEAEIELEASRSLSPHGAFLVDTENVHSQSLYTGFGESEHRNTLFILEHTPRLA